MLSQGIGNGTRN